MLHGARRRQRSFAYASVGISPFFHNTRRRSDKAVSRRERRESNHRRVAHRPLMRRRPAGIRAKYFDTPAPLSHSKAHIIEAVIINAARMGVRYVIIGVTAKIEPIAAAATNGRLSIVGQPSVT